MIKRIIACLTICLIITGLINPVFSDASALPQPNWSDPGISEIINISDLTGWMLNGGTFDVSQYTDAESFMNDYFNARTKTRLISPGEAAEDYYEVLPGFGINNQLVAGESFARPLDTNRVIASSYRDHTGYGRRLSNEVNEALLSSGSLYDTKIPLLNEVEFANFVGYNHDALRLYSEFFDIETPDPVTPQPEAWAIPYIKKANQPYYDQNNFFWKDQDFYYSGSIIGNLRGYSFVNTNGQINPGSLNSTQLIIPCKPITINITHSGSTYTLSSNAELYRGFIPKNQFSIFKNNQNQCVYNFGNDNISEVPSNLISYTSNSLTSLFDRISKYYAGVDIYVDGVLWALNYGNSIQPEIPPHVEPEFPDAVGGEDLPSTTWPISRPRAPYYTNVPGVLQAIEDAIADDGKLDIDDLKPYLTDENGDPVPDPEFDPEPVPLPVPDPVNPDVVPGLPELPAIPLDMPGFNGVSVLAEIINFTNQSLPTALIVTFWGIVFGIVILGLIKILHK